MIEVSWPGQPFLDRTIDKGDVLLVSGHRALLPRPPAAAARVRQPRRRRTTGIAQGRVLSVYPATEGLSFKMIRGIIDAHLDALLAAGDGVPAAATCCALARGAVTSATRCAWCTAPRRSARRMEGRARLAFEELLFVQLLQQRAKALAREARRGIRFENRRDAHDAAARGAAVPAHRRAERACCARSSPTCAATGGCTACCRATSAAARRSSRCSPRCWRWRTATRPRSWRPPSCSPSSTRAR